MMGELVGVCWITGWGRKGSKLIFCLPLWHMKRSGKVRNKVRKGKRWGPATNSAHRILSLGSTAFLSGYVNHWLEGKCSFSWRLVVDACLTSTKSCVWSPTMKEEDGQKDTWLGKNMSLLQHQVLNTDLYWVLFCSGTGSHVALLAWCSWCSAGCLRWPWIFDHPDTISLPSWDYRFKSPSQIWSMVFSQPWELLLKVPESW